MGRLMFVPLLAGVLFLASCDGEEKTSAPSPPAQSAGAQAGVAGAGVESGPEAESVEAEGAEAGQEQAVAGRGEGDSQLGDGFESSDVEAAATGEAATEESDASIPPEPTPQVAAGGEQEAAPAFAGEESERISGDSGAAVAGQGMGLALILAAAVVLVALLVSAGFLGWLLGRRASVAPTIPGVAPVATDATAVQGSAAGVPTVPAPTAEGLGELKDELVQAVLTFSKAVDERDAEIKRYKEGYDLVVFKRFLRRFINVDLALLHALKENPDDENLGNLQIFLDDAFEECGVRRFEPEQGSLYREEWGVQDHPKAISTADKSSDGRIAKVVEPGYQFSGQANEPILVWGAKVQIYRFEGKKEEA